MITLRNFDSSGPAEIARAALEAYGISCALLDENAHLYLVSAVPIRLVVSEDQATEAAQILDGLDLRSDSPDVSASGEQTV